MNKKKATEYLEVYGLTLGRAKEIVDGCNRNGKSVLNKNMTKAHALVTIVSFIDCEMEKSGPDFEIYSWAAGHRVIAKNIIRECL